MIAGVPGGERAVVDVDGDMMGFEGAVPERHDLSVAFAAKKRTKVFARLADTGGRRVSDSVWIGKRGARAPAELTFREDRLRKRHVKRWVIDPFRFFDRAFGLTGVPRPDFTTRNGRRIFYSQIDGDGLDTISEIDRESKCGALVRDRIFRRYDVPFTASVVVGLTAPPPVGRGSLRDVEVARSIFALPNIEIGSHGLAHPMDWRHGSIDGYTSHRVAVPDLPGYEMNAHNEIARSVGYIDSQLAPRGKRCRIMLWTGWCNPTEEHLEVAYRLGLRNMNGGDPRMDAHFPSYLHLVAPVHQVGGSLQFYTSAANDYILTDDWTPPYYRFRNVIQTFESSGHPRRVMPVDVYFHFYIAQKQGALMGLETVMDWVRDQSLALMFTSEYVDVARDFHWARMARVGRRRWAVFKGGALPTLRFDDPSVHVDIAKSEGVIGYLQDASLGVTYVHLDRGTRAVVQLARRAPTQPHLRSSTHAIGRVSGTAEAVEVAAEGIGRRQIVIAGMTPGARYQWAAGGGSASDEGLLTIESKSGATGWTTLKATRVTP